MIVVALGFSITANLFKIGSESLPRIHFVVLLFILETFFGIIFGLIRFKFKLVKKFRFKKNFLSYFVMGVLFLLSEIFFALSIVETKVAYATSVKRTAVIFSVVFGYVFFNEKNFKETITGSLIMLAGVVIISLFG